MARRATIRTAFPCRSTSTTTTSRTSTTTAADGGAHNIRVFENRCFNTAAGGLSAQPTFGGPSYFFRNIVYNGTSAGPLKLFDGGSGILVYQNTFFGQGTLLGPVSNVHFRNNLFLGDGWAGPVFNRIDPLLAVP